MKKVTEILREFKEEYPSCTVKVQELTGKLVEMGLLLQTDSGKRVSIYGYNMGLTEEIREKDGEEYIQVLYDETTEKITRNILYELTYPQNVTPRTVPAPIYDEEALEERTKIKKNNEITETKYRNTRKRYRELEKEYPNAILLLEASDKYWTFYDSAEKLGKIFKSQISDNAAGEINLTFRKDLLDVVISHLNKRQIDCYVDGPSRAKLYKAVVPPSVPKEIVVDSNAIHIGSKFEMIDSEGECKIFILNGANQTSLQIINRCGNTAELFEVPEMVDGNCQTLTEESALGKIVVGKHVNDTFECKDISYKVTRIII